MIVKLDRGRTLVGVLVTTEDRALSVLAVDGPDYDRYFAAGRNTAFVHATLGDDLALELGEPADWQEW